MEKLKFLPEYSEFVPEVSAEDMAAFRSFLEDIQEKMRNAPPPLRWKPKKRKGRVKKQVEDYRLVDLPFHF